MNGNPWVYIASPYTGGNVTLNVRFQLRVWNELFRLGFTPIAPLWAHFQDLYSPMEYADWMDYDRRIISRCDACLRLHAFDSSVLYSQELSLGADAEVELFRQLGKPVFTHWDELIAWAKEGQQ